MKPGEMYRCDFGPARGSEPDGEGRPAVVVSPRRFNQALNTVVVVPFTEGGALKGIGGRICAAVNAGVGGLEVDSTARANNIRVIDKEFLKEKTGDLPEEYLDEVYASVSEFLDLWG